MIEKIKQKFDKINQIYFEKEMGNEFLRVEVNLTSLDEITKYSREISNYIDEIDNSDRQYYLDIFSSGAEKTIEFDTLSEYMNKYINVVLNESIKDKDSFEGELTELNDEGMTIRWNAKGQFRNQEIKKEQVKSINLSAKIKKESK